MSRMVGGSVGLAAMGALVTTIGTSKINSALPHLPSPARAHIVSALGSGGGTGAHHVAPQITHAVNGAFISALGTGLEIGAVVMVAGAVIAWALIERAPARATPEAVAQPERLPNEERLAA
jgi:hypothetical protein